MSSMFKKSNRKYRQRAHQEDSDDEKTNEKTNEKQVNQIHFNENNNKNHFNADQEDDYLYSGKSNDKKISSKLSFHDDVEEDVDVFKVKKSSYSRRMAKQLEKNKKNKDNGVKDKEINKNKPKVKEEPKDELNVIWIKSETNVKKEEPNENIKIITGDEIDVEEDDQDQNNEPFHQFRGALERGVIPDAKTIYALKKQRQMARNVDDFVPLDDDEKYDDNQSRLIRDDDNDRSDDDDDERISFSCNKNAAEKEKAREAFLLAQEEEEDEARREESDDELDRWEREQIKKGVGMPAVQLMTQENAFNRMMTGQIPRYSLFSENYESMTPINMDIDQPKPRKSGSVPASLLKRNKTVSCDDIHDRIMDKLSSMKELLESHERQIVNINVEMKQSDEIIDRCKAQVPTLSQDYEFYQKTSRYVGGLFGCLDEKLPVIKRLEQKSLKLFKSRSEKFILRRQQDVRDQNEESSFIVKRLQSGTAPIIGGLSNFYDYGGDNLKRLRATEREGRRLRRRMSRQSTIPIPKHYDGLSSDDEEAESEALAYYEEKEKIEEEAKNIFADVMDEYSSLKAVISNFEEWRNTRMDSYKDAYIANCLPRLLGPFIVYELISWNPFDEKTRDDLEELSWFETLLFYGTKSKKQLNINDDPDLNLIPAIVDRIVLPRFTDLIENVWDPFSTHQTNQVVKLVSKWALEYPTVSNRSKNLQTLLHKIALRISRSLEEDIFIPHLFPPEVLENRSNPLALSVINFYQRQFWSGVKLFRNIISWQGIITDSVLQELALDRLLNRYLLFAINRTIASSDSFSKCQAIVLTLPRSWCHKNLPQLEKLSLLLKQLHERNSDPGIISEIVRLQNNI